MRNIPQPGRRGIGGRFVHRVIEGCQGAVGVVGQRSWKSPRMVATTFDTVIVHEKPTSAEGAAQRHPPERRRSSMPYAERPVARARRAKATELGAQPRCMPAATHGAIRTGHRFVGGGEGSALRSGWIRSVGSGLVVAAGTGRRRDDGGAATMTTWDSTVECSGLDSNGPAVGAR